MIEVQIDLICDVPGCRNHRSMYGPAASKALIQQRAEDAGWKLREDRDTCPDCATRINRAWVERHRREAKP